MKRYHYHYFRSEFAFLRIVNDEQYFDEELTPTVQVQTTLNQIINQVKSAPILQREAINFYERKGLETTIQLLHSVSSNWYIEPIRNLLRFLEAYPNKSTFSGNENIVIEQATPSYVSLKKQEEQYNVDKSRYQQLLRSGYQLIDVDQRLFQLEVESEEELSIVQEFAKQKLDLENWYTEREKKAQQLLQTEKDAKELLKTDIAELNHSHRIITTQYQDEIKTLQNEVLKLCDEYRELKFKDQASQLRIEHLEESLSTVTNDNLLLRGEVEMLRKKKSGKNIFRFDRK